MKNSGGQSNMLLKELHILNCRKIRQASIQFHGSGVQVIEGINQSGKTTIAQSIALTMNGPKDFTPGMISRGEEEAEIIAYTDDELKIRTVIAGNVKQSVGRYDEGLGRYVNVSGGVRTFLDSICSGLEQPWALRDTPDADVVEMLMTRSGATEKLTAIDVELKEKEVQRTEIGRDKKRMGEPVPAERMEHASPIDNIKEEREQAVRYIKRLSGEFARVSDEIRGMCDFHAVDDMRKVAAYIETNAKRIEAQIATHKAYTQDDVDAFDESLAAWYEAERKAAVYDKFIEDKNKWDELTCLYDDLTIDIEELRAKRKKTLADMKLGVKGLEIGEDNMLYHNGVLRGITKSNKTSNWSTAESVQVFFGLGARFAGQLKVLVVDNAESLDAKTTNTITQWAEKAGFLVIMLRVAEIPEELEEGVIYVREGEIVTKEAANDYKRMD
jgi:hypothetical protein